MGLNRISKGTEKFSESEWIDQINNGSTKVRFDYCETCQKSLAYIRSIQGHSGKETISPELMGHVLLPQRWKEFIFHEGCSFHVKSILEHGLIAGGKQSRDGRQTVFSHHSIHVDKMMKKNRLTLNGFCRLT